MTEHIKPSTEATVESRDERKARIVQVLSRGFINDRLAVNDLKPGWRVVWVRNNPDDIARYQTLGYKVETEMGTKYHQKAGESRIVGDVILMSIPLEDYEIIEEAMTEQKLARLDKGKRDFVKEASALGVPVVDETLK